MPKRKQPSRTAKEAHDAFIAAARELECSQESGGFVDVVKRLASAPPVPRGKAKKKPKG